MGKATKASGNPYYIARIAAAAGNDSFGSREGAAAAIGIDRTRLARIELGVVTPYPDEVRLIADAYNAPELLLRHCCYDCPIGQCIGMTPELPASSIEQLAVQSCIALRSAESIRESLIDIAADGIISPAERPALAAVLSKLTQISQIALQLNTIARKIGIVREEG